MQFPSLRGIAARSQGYETLPPHTSHNTYEMASKSPDPATESSESSVLASARDGDNYKAKAEVLNRALQDLSLIHI